MRLTVLGSGSPEAYGRRASSGCLLEIGTDRILFDCGGGVVDNLLRSGRLPRDITHLFFTHYHSDHMMDYARLVHAAWDEGAPPLKVLGPAPLKKLICAPAPNCLKASKSGWHAAAPCPGLGLNHRSPRSNRGLSMRATAGGLPRLRQRMPSPSLNVWASRLRRMGGSLCIPATQGLTRRLQRFAKMPISYCIGAIAGRARNCIPH